MFDISKLKTDLTGWIGFRNSREAKYPPIDSDITASGSGMYFDDFHPILTTEVLSAVAPQFSGYSTWSGATTYATGDTAAINDIAFESKGGGNLNHSPAAGAYWESLFSLWLHGKMNASIANLFNRLATEKKINVSTKSIFEDRQLFLGKGSMSDTITPSSRFVGLAIQPRNINNIRVTINKIGLQFTQAQTDLPIYLFNSQSKTYIKRQLVSTSVGYDFDWITLTDFNIDFVNYSDDIDSGSVWYIGYFEDDITGNAINKAYSWENGPCRSCPGALQEYSLYNLWSKYFKVSPIEFNSLDGVNLPSGEGYSMVSFGLNLGMTVKPDVTEILMNNKHILTYPLGLQFAIDMLSWIAYNPPRRTGAIQGNIEKNVILYDLNGEDGKSGLKKQYADALKALDFDFSDISTALPSQKPSGFKYGAI